MAAKTDYDGVITGFEERIAKLAARLVTKPIAMGPTGDKGPTGVNGPTGAAGATGPTGPTGCSGPAGPAGLAGPTGLTGERGPTGAPGKNAYGGTGPQGDAGPAGPKGRRGPTGDMGPTGPYAECKEKYRELNSSSVRGFRPDASVVTTSLSWFDGGASLFTTSIEGFAGMLTAYDAEVAIADLNETGVSGWALGLGTLTCGIGTAIGALCSKASVNSGQNDVAHTGNNAINLLGDAMIV